MTSGVFTAERNDLPLCNDTYKVSVWLGDNTQDYDVRIDALFFDFTSGRYHPRDTAPEISGSLSWSWQWELHPT